MLSNFKYSNCNSRYDEYDQCVFHLGWEIERFWKNFHEGQILYVVSGKFEENIDLDGGRSYFLHRSNLSYLLFDYLFSVKNFSLDDYSRIIYNSNELTDRIKGHFSNPCVVRNDRIDVILNKDEI